MIPSKIISTFAKLRRGRLIILFLLCVLLPTIPLGYLAVRSMLGEPESISQKINANLGRVGLAFAKMGPAGLLDCEADLGNHLDADLSLNETIEEVAEAINTCPLFHSFFILNSRLELVFPFSSVGKEVEEVGASGEAADRFSTNMKEGCRKEFRAGDTKGAIEDYRQALAHAEGMQYRAVAENAIARCFFKQASYREAKSYYRDIILKGYTNTFYGGLSLNLLAMHQLAAIDVMTGNEKRAAERFLDIMRALAKGELAGSVHEAIFYALTTEREMDKLIALPELARQYRPGLTELLRRWQYMKEAALDIGNLREKASANFEELLGNEEEMDRGFTSVAAVIDGVETIILCRKLVERDSNGPLLLAVVLDHLALRNEVGGVLHTMLESEEDINAAIYDSSGRAVVEEGDMSSSSGYEMKRSLAPALPSWRLKLAYRKKGLLFEMAMRDRMTRLTSIFFLVAVIFLGLYVSYRSIKRDTELAKMKSDFVSRVSHELRTPLATIRAVGEMLDIGAVSSREKEKEYFRLITSESERLSRLIDNVLDFSKIGTERKTYNLRTADITKTVANTLRVFRQYVKSEGFEIVFEADEKIPVVVIDEDAISQALINLLDNAVKFSREEKTVWVELRWLGAEVALSVKDRGIGIATEDLDKIFDQFYRPKEATELSGKGAGIGLAIVKHVAEAHGGRIEVKSSKGEGSVFTLLLPAEGAVL